MAASRWMVTGSWATTERHNDRSRDVCSFPLPGLRCQTAPGGRAVKRAASAAAAGGAEGPTLTALPPALPPASPRRGNEHTSRLWSLCRSVVPNDPVTIQHDAAITILAVRQQLVLEARSARARLAVLGVCAPASVRFITEVGRPDSLLRAAP